MTVTHHHGAVTDVTAERTWSERLGPAQVIAFLVGVFFIVNGLIGVIRTGIEEFPGPTTEVLGLSMTALLALLHIAYGLIALTGMGSNLVARSIMGLLGAVAIIGGIVALSEPVDAMGWSDTNAIVYLITGAVALISMLFAHYVVTHDRVIADRDVV